VLDHMDELVAHTPKRPKSWGQGPHRHPRVLVSRQFESVIGFEAPHPATASYAEGGKRRPRIFPQRDSGGGAHASPIGGANSSRAFFEMDDLSGALRGNVPDPALIEMPLSAQNR